MGHRKAYSSSQTVNLSPAILSRLLGSTVLWHPRAPVNFNLKNKDLDLQNLLSMLKFSNAASPGLFQLVSAQFALEMCPAAQNRQNISLKPLF